MAFGRIDPLATQFLAGQIAIALFSLAAAFTDFLWGRIFNWNTVTMFLAGLAASFYAAGWIGLAEGAAAAFLGLLLYGWMFALRVMGGGDVKFLMALGAWGGLGYVLEVALLGILLGGLMAVGVLAARGRLRSFYERMQHFFLTLVVRELKAEAPRIDRSSTMPFGIPIAVAAVWSAWSHPLRQVLFELGVRL